MDKITVLSALFNFESIGITALQNQFLQKGWKVKKIQVFAQLPDCIDEFHVREVLCRQISEEIMKRFTDLVDFEDRYNRATLTKEYSATIYIDDKRWFL